jgi:type VI secretion system protein ImpL
VRQLLEYLPLPRRWLAMLVGALAFATLLWYLGPTFAFGQYRPFESVNARLIAVGVILVLWLVAIWYLGAREAAANKKLIEGAAGSATADGDRAAAEIAALRRGLEEAQRHLKRLRGPDRRGKKYLYELPWYILIGPPGAGKTTALTNCGLRFPVAQRQGTSRPLRGAAGTRNCDWFLTDEAVLVDTAGRYTTQDSDATADQGAWLGFLDLLKETRPRQPINGVLVAISLSDLATLPETERQAHAAAVRARLAELTERFSVRFPIYVLFTKADLISGFVETYDPLTREEREQVWGMTLPFDAGDEVEPPVVKFDEEFRLLLNRLDERMLERVQQEADPRRRGLIFGFPTQIASLSDIMREFLEEVFLASRFETRPLLRGVYFTSGTQEGTPIDRLMGAIAQRFGLERQRLAGFSGPGRSYFLTRLLREVVFAEASIVSADPRVERRQRLTRWAIYGVTAAVLLAAGSLLAASYFEVKNFETQVRAAVEAALAASSPLDERVLHDDDPSRVIAALDKLRRLPGGYEAKGPPLALPARIGLYSGAGLHSEEVAAYRRGLNLLLLPRMLSRLQKQLAANMTKPEFLYEGLRIYLMLGARHPVDRPAVEEWLTLDWQSAYPGIEQAATRAALLAHLKALLEGPLEEYPLDANTVDEARRILRQFPLAGRVYLMLKQRLAAAAIPEWRVVDHAGPAADRVLRRLSGKLLSDGVSGAYTRPAFYKVVLPLLPDLVKAAEADDWILSDTPDTAGADRSDTLTNDVLALYYEDYARQWEGLLGDLSLLQARTAGQAADMLELASGPNSPLLIVWQAIDRETQLRHRPPELAATAAPSSASTSATARTNQAHIASLLAPAGQPVFGQPVEDRFRAYHELVASIGGGTAIVELFLQDLTELSKDINRLAAAAPGPADAGGLTADAEETAHKIENWAARFPPAIAEVPKAIARNVSVLIKGEAHGDIDLEWETKVLPVCTRALVGRYPVQRGSEVDVAPDDFARLFAPNGLIDGFVNTSLRPFVDMSRTPWQVRPAESGGVNLSADALAQFQRAARIRDAFFSGGSGPVLRLEITPVSVDPGTRAVLNIEGQEIAFDGSGGRPVAIQWPGPSGIRQSTLTFDVRQAEKKEASVTAATPAQASPAAPAPAISTTGAWSLFRLLDAGRLQRIGGPDRWRVSFSANGHRAVYEIHAGSVINPLASRDLAEFKCPPSL